MQVNVVRASAALSDTELLDRVKVLAAREREATAELVAHLAELDARRLDVAEGYASLFRYCRRRSASLSTPRTTGSKRPGPAGGSP